MLHIRRLPLLIVIMSLSGCGGGDAPASGSSAAPAASGPATPGTSVSTTSVPTPVGSTVAPVITVATPIASDPAPIASIIPPVVTDVVNTIVDTVVDLIGGGSPAPDPAPVPVATAGGPVVFNATVSAKADDIVTLQGANFGKSPEVRLLTANGALGTSLPLVNRVDDWLAVRIPGGTQGAIIVRVVDGPRMSSPVKLNAAQPYHLDSLEIAPGGTFRVFGRNLQLAGSTASVSVNGQSAAVQPSRSNEHMLVAVAPANIAAGMAAIAVDNGNGSGPATADRQVTVIDTASGDPFGLDVGWSGVFTPLTKQIVNIPCSGKSISDPVRQAIDKLAASGGGTIQLGAGQCTLDAGIGMRDNIVLQGAGKTDTVITYGRDYPIWAEKLNRIAIRNLTLANAGTVQEGPLLKANRQIVLQNVAMRFGTQKQAFFTENEDMIVSGCDFVQTGSIGQQSPYLFTATHGLVFIKNTTNFMSGAATFERVTDAYIVNNAFIRDTASQLLPGALHMMTVDFATRIAVVGNSFSTNGGPITNKNRNDGEAILTEGGGPNRTENLGTVVSATDLSLTDPSLVLKTDPFGDGKFPANYGIAIVAGKGAGQTRYVTGFTSGTISIDHKWDMIPDGTSQYATFVWGLEKSLLKDNRFDQMPRGIWLYQAAIRDVDVVGNIFREGGGVYLRAYQNVASKMFDPIYNVRIDGNTVTNQTKNWMSYMTAVFVNSDGRAFGMGMTNIGFYRNSLVANAPNIESNSEEYAGAEGYFNMMRVENYSIFEAMTLPRLLGTIFQGNGCTNCAVDYRIGTGAGGTIIDDAIRQNSKDLMANWKTSNAPDLATATIVD